MNLHGIAGPIIAAVNPTISADFQRSTGSTTLASGKQVPTYADAVCVPAQVQALTYRDLLQLEGLNIEGSRVAIYLYGEANNVVRVTQKGGDLITIRSGANRGVYLTAQVLEQWPDWCKVAATLQNQDP